VRLLRSAARHLELLLPCFKRYLYKHVEGSAAMVQATEWEIAVFLPTEQFRKSGKRTVWKDSRQKV
jgi:hypothetical protein